MEQENVDKFVDRINKVLARAQEADETASWALKRNVGSKKDDFNSRVHSTFDSADAGRALQLAQKGKDMSDKELKEFNGLLKANRNDKEFAEKFAVGMGGRGTLEFWSEMADPGWNSTGPVLRTRSGPSSWKNFRRTWGPPSPPPRMGTVRR
ncbi:hypothetical protein ACFV1B_27410 [Streptomyces sp. NPDC059637]